MKYNFIKMQGTGNDYIYFDCLDNLDCLESAFKRPAPLARQLSDRHFSIGGDGIVLMLPSEVADVKMRMFNADGSEGMMCGNAVRCVAKYLYDFRKVDKRRVNIETGSGVKTVYIKTQRRSGEAFAFTVDMGKPNLRPDRLPSAFRGETAIGRELEVGGKTYSVTCLSMGNPHCVVFGDDPDLLDLASIGPLFEHHPVFPLRVNTEFVQAVGKNELKMRVWERGSGETFACGTGACAAAVAAILNGHAEQGAEITVHLKGGDLKVVYTGKTVLLTGGAETVFTGTIEL